MKVGIRLKWMASYLSVGIAVLFFIVFYLRSTLVSYFESRFENRWKRELGLAKTYLESSGFESMTLKETDRWADEVGAILEMRVTVIGLQGKVVGDSKIDLRDLPEVEDHSGRPEVVQALSLGFGKSTRHSTTIDLDLVYLALPLGNVNEPRGVVRVAVEVSEIDGALSQIRRLIWFASGLGFVMVLVTGFFLSKSMTYRLNEMARAAKRFSEGKFGQKIEQRATDELGELSNVLNQMAEELKKNITDVTRERDQLQTILNGMVEGVVVTDLSGLIILSNRSFLDIFNLTEPVIQKSTAEVFRNTQLLNALEQAMDENKEMVETLELVSPVRKQLEAHIAILGPEKQPTGTVAVFHDVTRLKQLEQVRRDFVANVSHELRTPLTAIKGYAETLLSSSSLNEDRSIEFLKTINKHADRMAKLVDDLLTLSKVESVQFDEAFEAIDLWEIISSVTDRFKDLVENKDLVLTTNVPKGAVAVKGIGSEIESVFENLIENAIKYGSRGGQVAVSIKRRKSEIEVAISDDGIGIPLEEQSRVFERFYRVDKGRSRALGGTGLGLSIVKHIIQRHGGKIWVESELGKGTTFRFTLPKA